MKYHDSTKVQNHQQPQYAASGPGRFLAGLQAVIPKAFTEWGSARVRGKPRGSGAAGSVWGGF